MTVITDKSHKLVYCHVPKAASTTWMVAFAKMNQVENYAQLIDEAELHGTLLHEFGHKVDSNDSEAFKFTFIRHPFQRIVRIFYNFLDYLLD